MRFKIFTGNWQIIKLKSIVKETKCFTSNFEEYPLYSFTIENGVTPKTDRYERGFLVKKDGDTFKVISPGEFVMNPMNLRFGAINYSKLDIPVSVSGYYDIFRIDNGEYNDFWYAYLSNKKTLNRYNRIATGSLEEKKRVHFSQLVNLNIKAPCDDEKLKINNLLFLINSRITTQKKIIEDYKALKNQIINTIYNTDVYNSKLSNLIIQISKRNKNNTIDNVLSVSNKYGFIKQSEQFEDREVASDDISNYKIISKDIFAYNPARINVGSIAKYNNEDEGIVSPMYICFKTKDALLPEYLNYYFDSNEFKYQMSKRLEGSVRQCLTFESLINIPFKLPSLEEQKKNADIISTFNNKIAFEEKYLKVLELQKSYLLNNMFI